MAERDIETQLRGGRLTLAEVIYYLPDHPKLLQSFTWQTLDVAPEYPRLRTFLDYWRCEIDAVIHSVSIAGVGLITPAKVAIATSIGRLH